MTAAYTLGETARLRIVDAATGNEADPDAALRESWAHGLYQEAEEWVVSESGAVGMTDTMDGLRWAPAGRYRVDVVVSA